MFIPRIAPVLRGKTETSEALFLSDLMIILIIIIKWKHGNFRQLHFQGFHNQIFISFPAIKQTMHGPYTAISRQVVGKSVHATIPKGNMGYSQYTVPDQLSCRTYFCCFSLALTNILPRSLVPFF